MVIELLKAVLYGIVEGLTEWLPISSTGHMILFENIVKLKVSEQFMTVFLVVIQLGAILAVVVLYWHKIFPFNFKHKNRPFIKYDIINLWVKILIACLPAGIIGILFDDVFDKYLYNSVVVSIMLVVIGIAFLVIESSNKDRQARVKSIANITYRDAIIIGIFQLIAAIFPGTSRSGATILGGLMIGVSRTIAAEFTFFLAIPVMFGASVLKIVKFGFAFSSTEVAILVSGMLVAFLVSMIVIRFLMSYIKKHDFTIFGWYRIVLGIIVILCFFLNIISI